MNIPKHGFMARPSALWPIPTIPDSEGRVITTVTNSPPKPGLADTLKPSQNRLENEATGEVFKPGETIKSQGEMLDTEKSPTPGHETLSSSLSSEQNQSVSSTIGDNEEGSHWEPKPPKVLMQDSNSTPLELRSQIQMYAATECALFTIFSLRSL